MTTTAAELCKNLFSRCSVAVALKDPEAALEIVNDLRALEGSVHLVMTGPRVRTMKFVGKPMFARFGGQCVVCGQRFARDAEILYAKESKNTAHLACGEPIA